MALDNIGNFVDKVVDNLKKATQAEAKGLSLQKKIYAFQQHCKELEQRCRYVDVEICSPNYSKPFVAKCDLLIDDTLYFVNGDKTVIKQSFNEKAMHIECKYANIPPSANPLLVFIWYKFMNSNFYFSFYGFRNFTKNETIE